MKYAQLKQDGTFDKEVQPGPISFDANNYCTVEALIRDGKAGQFRVVELLETPEPAFNPVTESVGRDGAEFVNDRWQYKWRVSTLSAEQVLINQAAAAAKMQEDIIKAMDNLFDTTAQSKRYDSRVTCALRAGYTGPFQAEGIAFATWMDTCNALGYQLLAEVQAGTREMPSSVENALVLLPPMVWPE